MTATLSALPIADPDDAVDYLLDLDDDEFAEVVQANVHPKASARIWDALLDDDLVLRTKNTLGAIHQQLNVQIAARAARNDEQPDPEYPDWRRRVDVLSRYFLVRIAQAKQASRERQERAAASADAQNRELVRALTLAIFRHRNACIAADLAPEPHDVDLWSALDELKLANLAVGAPERSLADMVVSGIWHDPERAAS